MKLYTVCADPSTWGSDCTADTIISSDEVKRLSEEWEKPVEELLTELTERDELFPIVTILTNGSNWDRQVIYWNSDDHKLYSDHDADPLDEGTEYKDFDSACQACWYKYVNTTFWEPEWIADQD